MTTRGRSIGVRITLLLVAAVMAALGVASIVVSVLLVSELDFSGWGALLWIPAFLGIAVAAVVSFAVAYAAGRNALSQNP